MQGISVILNVSMTYWVVATWESAILVFFVLALYDKDNLKYRLALYRVQLATLVLLVMAIIYYLILTQTSTRNDGLLIYVLVIGALMIAVKSWIVMLFKAAYDEQKQLQEGCDSDAFISDKANAPHPHDYGQD